MDFLHFYIESDVKVISLWIERLKNKKEHVFSCSFFVTPRGIEPLLSG